MADNRVVIKINYDKDKAIKALIEPKMVTVWHTRRILTVFAFLLFMVIAIFFWISTDNHDENKLDSDTTAEASANNAVQITQATKPINSIQLEIESNTNQIPVVKRPDAIILDKRVIRASLGSAPAKDEPGEPIKSPVVIQHNQTLELFYFVQIKNVKNSILFHRWYKDRQLMSKKQFVIKTNNARLISSQKLTSNQVGQWQVVLIDKKGKLLSEVNYSVTP